MQFIDIMQILCGGNRCQASVFTRRLPTWSCNYEFKLKHINSNGLSDDCWLTFGNTAIETWF